ncbi:MAG: patatin-like phospholipase family protein [Pseudomonadales bacterium]
MPISLVLGCGGARGVAHIGAIKCLTERGFEIRNVSGSSMGALIGGIYAAGKLDVYESWLKTLQRRDITGSAGPLVSPPVRCSG